MHLLETRYSVSAIARSAARLLALAALVVGCGAAVQADEASQSVQEVLARAEAAEARGVIEGSLVYTWRAPTGHEFEQRFSFIVGEHGEFRVWEADGGTLRVCDGETVLVSDAKSNKAYLYSVESLQRDFSLAINALGRAQDLLRYLKPLGAGGVRRLVGLVDQYEFDRVESEDDKLVLSGFFRLEPPYCDIRVTVDPELDYQVVAIEEGDGVFCCDYQDFRKMADGRWVPWAWQHQVAVPETGRVYDTTQIVAERIEFGTSVDADSFAMVVPDGARVSDFRQWHTYTAWRLGERIEEVIDEADFALMNIFVAQPNEMTFAHFLPHLGALAGAATCLVVLVRRRRRRTQQAS